jgi:7-keto-8-aminopelargonate synthetase-like enzyme
MRFQIKSEIGNYLEVSNKKYSFFAGNNYLGLAGHPNLKRAAKTAIDQYGLNFAAARHTTGTSDIHLELEKELSAFKDEEDSVVFASGYMGNGILLQVLKERYNTVFTDESSHPSILEGIPHDIRNIHLYRHGDMQHLEDLLIKHRNHPALIITEGVFALTGEISPIDEIYALAHKYNLLLIVDDAHATGVLGESGKGTPEYFNLLHAPDLYQTETMSKALGVYGGFISSGREIISLIRERSTTCLGSTSLPPPLVSAACASIRMVRQQPELRPILYKKAGDIRRGIIGSGYHTNQAPTPIIPVFFDSPDQARNLSLYLERNGIIAPCISYPVKMNQFIVRITVSVNHTPDQIEELLETLKKWKSPHGTPAN